MKWNRFTIKTKTDAEDMIICTLAEIGVEGAEIQDHQPLTEEDKAQMFVDIMPEGPEDDGVAYLNFYLEEDADKDAILRDVRNALEELRTFMDIGEGTIEESQTEDKDWINNWKEFFHQFYVDDILIVPSWEEIKEEDKDKMILHIDPGTAFGTGMHETTQLVIRQLKKYVKPTIVMLPMNIISDISGNCALAIRLYGNIMSGMIIGAVVSKIVFLALGFPIFLSILSFISSVIQAYIFSILALVFILSAEN